MPGRLPQRRRLPRYHRFLKNLGNACVSRGKSALSRLLPVLLLLGAAAFSGMARAAEVDYERDVKPLLKEKCVSCHGPLGQEAGLRLDAAALIHAGSENGSVIASGQPDESLLIERVSAGPHDRMPPKGEGEALTAEQLAVLKAWISSGAPAPEHEEVIHSPADHWAYQPIRRPEVAALDKGNADNPIDALIAATQADRGTQPVGPADKATLLRRVMLDLTGLPPTESELRAFLADNSPTAYPDLVDRLLASPHYGERWGRHWMDVWRYSDWDGYRQEVRGSQKHIWRWRDWIIESLNADKPYDQMLLEMLAGDEIAPEDPDTLRATGYLVRNFHVSNRDIWLDAAVEHSAKAFLGMTIACARCHNHKFDPISQQEYYQYRAIFEPHRVRTERLPGQPDINADGLPRAYDADPDAPTYLYVGGNEKQPDKERPLAPAAPHIVAAPFAPVALEVPARARMPLLREEFHQEDLQHERQQLAAARAAVDKLRAETTPPAPTPPTPGEPASPALPAAIPYETQLAEWNLRVAAARLESVAARWAADLKKFAAADREAVEDDETRTLARRAAACEAVFQRESAESKLLQAWKALEDARATPPGPQRMPAINQATKALALAGKDREKSAAALRSPGETYSPVSPTLPSASTGRRLALARWIIHPDNPLAARVAANQIWMRHFGQPLVETVYDFGLRAPRPVQAALLDWLADELRANNWSMKRLHRLIVNSRAYCRASSGDAAALARNSDLDPANETFWRVAVQRLDAEIVRDSLLHLSGMLDVAVSGPDLPFAQGETLYRRSLYFQHAYEKQMTMLVLFDAASPTECYRRSPSVIPQQALALSNSALSLSAARKIALQLSGDSREAPRDDDSFIRAAFERLLSRQPLSDELAVCLEFLQEQSELLARPEALQTFEAGPPAATPPAESPAARARENLVHVLLNHNDFISAR